MTRPFTERTPSPGGGVRALKAFVAPRRRPSVEVCDLCSAPVGPGHEHLLASAAPGATAGAERLRCACQACAMLFPEEAGASWRRVPSRATRVPAAGFTAARWAALGVPIGLAFFVRRVDGAVLARYPSPFGVMELALAPETLRALALIPAPPGATDALAALGDLEPRVEALLVNRLGAEPIAYRVSIDHAYALVGLVRTHWHGLSGGDAVTAELTRFFEVLDGHSGGRDVLR